MNCKKCGLSLGDSTYCPICGVDNKEEEVKKEEVNFENEEQVNETPAAAPERPMKWYKFLINFLLFASAAINVIGAFMYFTGAYYEGAADLVYMVFPAMQTYDMMMGVLSLGIAAIAILARFDLAGYKKRSKIMITILYAANAVVPLLYAILASSVIGQSLIDATVIGSVVGSLVMIVLNWVYFTKRDDLFTK